MNAKNFVRFIFWLVWIFVVLALYAGMFYRHSIVTQTTYIVFVIIWLYIGYEIIKQLLKDLFDNPNRGCYTCVAKESDMYNLPNDVFICDYCQEKYFFDDACDYGDVYVCEECLELLTADDEELYDDV